MPPDLFLWTLSIPPALLEARRQELLALLGPEEQARYQKIGHEQRQIEYLVGHALLRLKVSETLGSRPGELLLRWKGEKKPILKGLGHFVSLSHKKDRVVAALAPGPIGIDLEFVEEGRFKGHRLCEGKRHDLIRLAFYRHQAADFANLFQRLTSRDPFAWI